jgi:ribose/xylose/arabinose/galactoside ABC-type transport system permease subunit
MTTLTDKSIEIEFQPQVTVFSLSGGDSEMFDFTNIGKLFIVIGVLIAGIGVALLFSGKVPWLGRLPGDFLFQGKQSSFYFPLTTCILISVVISLVMWFINRR